VAGRTTLAVVNDDSERQKDTYLVNVFYRKSEQDNYAPLTATVFY
jgi:hypothetical protein